MSHGSGPKPAPPKQVPVTIEPTPEKTESDELARLKKARSRALSQVANTGLLSVEPVVGKNMLSDKL